MNGLQSPVSSRPSSAEQLTAVPTHCPYCAFQCGMILSTSSSPDGSGGRIPLQVSGRPGVPGEQRSNVHQGVDIGRLA